MHKYLLIEYKNGIARKESVHAEHLGDGLYKLKHSPGFVLGIAAGDTFRIINDDGRFEVLVRGGNLCVQIFSHKPIVNCLSELETEIQKMHGVLDGSISNGAVFTIPVSAGFEVIENTFNEFVSSHTGMEWFYGNVYDPIDGETPLNWWK